MITAYAGLFMGYNTPPVTATDLAKMAFKGLDGLIVGGVYLDMCRLRRDHGRVWVIRGKGTHTRMGLTAGGRAKRPPSTGYDCYSKRGMGI